MSLYSHSLPTPSLSSNRKSVSIVLTMLKARSLAALDIGIMTNASITFANSRLAHRVIAHVTCLPTKLLGESGQQITLAFLPSGWISVLLLILGPPTFQIT